MAKFKDATRISRYNLRSIVICSYFFSQIKTLKLWLGRWGGGHDGAHASVSTSCFSVTCNAVDRPQNIVKRQCWNASHRNLNTWFLPWEKKTTKLQIEKGNHQIIYNMFYQCLSSFSTKSFRKRFFEECEVPTILLEKTHIYILNQWGQLLRNLVIRAFSMQKITTIQPSMFGQTWKQFQCISMTNRHTKKNCHLMGTRFGPKVPNKETNWKGPKLGGCN